MKTHYTRALALGAIICMATPARAQYEVEHIYGDVSQRLTHSDKTSVEQYLYNECGLSRFFHLVQKDAKTDEYGNTHTYYHVALIGYDSPYALERGDTKIMVHTNAAGQPYFINGQIARDPRYSRGRALQPLHPSELISPDEAVCIAWAASAADCGAAPSMGKVPAAPAAVGRATLTTIISTDGILLPCYMVASGVSDFFVDAQSGEILQRIPRIISLTPSDSDTEGTAETLYYGVQPIVSAPAPEGHYRLRDNKRNITTFNAYDMGPLTQGLTDEEFYSSTFHSLISGKQDNLCDYVSLTGDWTGVAHNVWIDRLHLEADEGLPAGRCTIDCKLTDVRTGESRGLLRHATLTFAPGEKQHDLSIGAPMPEGVRLTVSIQPEGGAPLSYTPNIMYGETGNPEEVSTGLFASVICHCDSRQPALDVHWGMQQTYDAFLDLFHVDSYDDRGSEIVQIVNFQYDPKLSLSTFNAFACPEGDPATDGTNYLLYGMGQPGVGRPVTKLEVAAHEFTHSVVYFIGHDLKYEGESGALNESTADCIAQAVVHHALGSTDWKIGAAIGTTSDNMRNMADPWLSRSADGVTIDPTKAFPKYYGGRYWQTLKEGERPDASNDQGYVHYNSSVGNYLFYLIAEGGEVTNEMGDSFRIEGIGVERAAQLCFHSLRYYLTKCCNYEEYAACLSRAAADCLEGDERYRTLRTIAQSLAAVGLASLPTPPTTVSHPAASATEAAMAAPTYDLQGRISAVGLEGGLTAVPSRHGVTITAHRKTLK